MALPAKPDLDREINRYLGRQRRRILKACQQRRYAEIGLTFVLRAGKIDHVEWLGRGREFPAKQN